MGEEEMRTKRVKRGLDEVVKDRAGAVRLLRRPGEEAGGGGSGDQRGPDGHPEAEHPRRLRRVWVPPADLHAPHSRQTHALPRGNALLFLLLSPPLPPSLPSSSPSLPSSSSTLPSSSSSLPSSSSSLSSSSSSLPSSSSSLPSSSSSLPPPSTPCLSPRPPLLLARFSSSLLQSSFPARAASDSLQIIQRQKHEGFGVGNFKVKSPIPLPLPPSPTCPLPPPVSSFPASSSSSSSILLLPLPPSLFAPLLAPLIISLAHR
eukprot:684610-Hanusia_phi.AAC.2